MKRQVFITLIFLLAINICSNAKPRFFIFINPNECSNWIQNANVMLKEFGEGKLAFVMYERNRRFGHKYICEKISVVDESSVMFSDSLSDIFNKSKMSAISIVYNDQLVHKFLLTELPMNWPLIYAYSSDYYYTSSYAIPKDIALSNYVKVKSARKLVVCDRDFGIVYVYDSSLTEVFNVKNPIFLSGLKEEVIKQLDIKLSGQKYELFYPEVTSFDVTDNALKMLISVNYKYLIGYKGEERHFGVKRIIFLVEVKDGMYHYYYIDESKADKSIYEIDETILLSLNHKTYVGLDKIKIGLGMRFLGEIVYDSISTNYVYSKALKINLPKMFKQLKLDYNYVDPILRCGYIYHNICNEIWDIANKKYIRLSEFNTYNSFDELSNPTINFEIYDILKDGPVVKILLEDQGKVYINYYDSESFGLLRREKLDIKDDELLTFPKFTTNRIVYFTQGSVINSLSLK